VSVSIQVTVEQGLTAALQQLIEDYPEAVGQALLRIAEQVLQLSNVLVPVRTGFLKSTLGVRQNSNFSITFYASAPYAAYVEFGTHHMSARLFMTRALQQYQNAFAPEVAGTLQQLQEAYFG
jgi:HK97 gp10 family phage protein